MDLPTSIARQYYMTRWHGSVTHLRKRAIVPDIAVVRKTVAHITQASLLDVLFNRVKGLFL